MPIKFQESFRVQASVERVWRFLTDPHEVVTCMPGAELVEVQDERTFRGHVKVRLGPITVAYAGRVHLEELDEVDHRVCMVGEGRETGGAGSARMRMLSQVRALPDGGAEVVVDAEVDLAGRVVQFGRGMVEDVARQLFQDFAACVRARMERPLEAPVGPTGGRPVRAIPLAWRALGQAIVRFFRRLLGKT
ncbi:MAG: SRPBCC family protein [Acidobacteria bacterium]|nr:SRPBCC family protein [Acidobacteriota bacterium]MDW7985424.1 SRPBCC family protein [Acidobacteriota bacterium]